MKFLGYQKIFRCIQSVNGTDLLRASDGRHFVFNVTRGPKHGMIDVLASNKMDVMRSNTSFFTSSEISEERLLYRHDDSESRRDAFHLVATSDSYSVRRPASSSSEFQGRNSLRFLGIAATNCIF